MGRVKVPKKTSALLSRFGEVHRKHASPRLQNSFDLESALLACDARQMVKHYRCQHNVNLSVDKRQCLGDAIFKDNFDSSSSRLFACAGDHLRRCVDPKYGPLRPYMLFGCDCES